MSAKQSKEIAGSVHPFRDIRRAGVPLSVLTTADPAEMLRHAVESLNGRAAVMPLIGWDCVRGVFPLGDRELPGLKNPLGEAYIATIPDEIRASSGMMPAGLINYMTDHPPIGDKYQNEDTPTGGALFALNLNRVYNGPNGDSPDMSTIQALWNGRDIWKRCGVSCTVLGCDPALPAELKNDVVQFEETPPGPEIIERIARSLASDAGLPDSALANMRQVVDACLGYLSAFNVETALSLALGRNGFNVDKLWALKVQALKQAAGLEISLPKKTFADLAGSEGFKRWMLSYLSGRIPPRAILWLDEVEKMIAGGTGGDLSGTTQALLEQFLFWSESRKVHGVLLVGVPGAGKSESCQCTAGQAGVPLLRASMSTVKGGIVGQSEQQMRNLLKCVDTVAQGHVLMIATCNSLEALSPEIMARFRSATFVYDYPTAEESAAIWAYYMGKYNLSGPVPPSKNWVGREISSCCETAWMFNQPLTEAAQYVVPVSIANASKMEALRKNLSGRFLSAARPGFYSVETVPAAQTGRRVDLGQ